MSIVTSTQMKIMETDVLLMRIGGDFEAAQEAAKVVGERTGALVILIRPGESLKKLRPDEARRLHRMLDRKING